MKEYRLRGTSLLCRGRVPFAEDEAKALVYRALGKKRARAFFGRLKARGEATVRWKVVSYLRAGEDNWARLHCVAVNGQFRFFCSGPRAVDAVRKANRLEKPSEYYWLNKQEQKELKRASAKRLRRKHKKKETRPKAEAQASKPRKEKARAANLAKAQFSKNCITWDEAIDATMYIFDIVRDSKNSARQIAARRLYNSLAKHEWRATQYKQSGFTLRFEMQGPWLVDTSTNTVMTPVAVLSTKDNRNVLYRRLRKYLKRTLQGLTPLEQKKRRAFFARFFYLTKYFM